MMDIGAVVDFNEGIKNVIAFLIFPELVSVAISHLLLLK